MTSWRVLGPIIRAALSRGINRNSRVNQMGDFLINREITLLRNTITRFKSKIMNSRHHISSFMKVLQTNGCTIGNVAQMYMQDPTNAMYCNITCPYSSCNHSTAHHFRRIPIQQTSLIRSTLENTANFTFGGCFSGLFIRLKLHSEPHISACIYVRYLQKCHVPSHMTNQGTTT